MMEGRPSRTAQRVAMRRAAHQLCDVPLVFSDPLALSILGEEAAGKVRSETEEERLAPVARTMRAFMAVRSRFAEDELAAAVERGVRQYVVLGAGLDTFAYRNPHAELMVYEVDHPATQEWKRYRVERAGFAGHAMPPSLRFAPVDFERETLADGLAAAAFRSGEPAFFSWLGVVPYLTLAAARATLAWIGGLPPGSAVAFDYAIPPHTLNRMERMAFDALAERVARAGEPFQLFFTPEELERELRSAGFRELDDLDSDAINTRYFAGRADELHVRGKVGRLVCARV
jgi:methyltransferase (TIGR00027 family)